MIRQHEIDFGDLKPRNCDVEPDFGQQDGKITEFGGERFAVPSGVECDPVRCQGQRSLLGIVQVRELDRRAAGGSIQRK